jgi:transposase
MEEDVAKNLGLVTQKVGAVPIINTYLERLRIPEMLSRRVIAGHEKIPPQICIELLVKNIMIEREPMYNIGEWSSKYAPSLLGVSQDQLRVINDDRIGRVLDSLYDADRSSMLTEIVVGAVKEFNIKLDEFHNDSTTVTFFGTYLDAVGDNKRGKRSVKITYGKNKEHRPDLKQILWTLTTTNDGCVPVHYMTLDGNTNDSTTHIDMWNAVKGIKGSSDFIYIADSKLCVETTMKYIDGQGGKFITVLPATRIEDRQFREYIQTSSIDWKTVNGADGDFDESAKFKVADSPLPSSDGFRIVWVWSSQKKEKDKTIRTVLIKNAIVQLNRLEESLQSSRSRIRTRDAVIKKADAAVADAKRYVTYKINEDSIPKFKQGRRGRPGKDTTYIKNAIIRFHVEWETIDENIKFDINCDGLFPLLTNCIDIPPEVVLEKYKHQPMLEKRHQQLKSVYDVMPVLFKNVERIEAFLFVYFIVMLIQALIERQIRMSMKEGGIRTLPLYPEGKECYSPTTDRVVSIFADVQKHHLFDSGNMIKTFDTPLDELQMTLLSLAGVPTSSYGGAGSKFKDISF